MNLHSQDELYFRMHRERYSNLLLPHREVRPKPTVIKHALAGLGTLFINIGIRLMEHGEIKAVPSPTTLVIEGK